MLKALSLIGLFDLINAVLCNKSFANLISLDEKRICYIVNKTIHVHEFGLFSPCGEGK